MAAGNTADDNPADGGVADDSPVDDGAVDAPSVVAIPEVCRQGGVHPEDAIPEDAHRVDGGPVLKPHGQGAICPVTVGSRPVPVLVLIRPVMVLDAAQRAECLVLHWVGCWAGYWGVHHDAKDASVHHLMDAHDRHHHGKTRPAHPHGQRPRTVRSSD